MTKSKVFSLPALSVMSRAPAALFLSRRFWMWMPNCVFSLVQAAKVPSGRSELNIIWPGGRCTQMPCAAFPPVFTYARVNVHLRNTADATGNERHHSGMKNISRASIYGTRTWAMATCPTWLLSFVNPSQIVLWNVSLYLPFQLTYIWEVQPTPQSACWSPQICKCWDIETPKKELVSKRNSKPTRASTFSYVRLIRTR